MLVLTETKISLAVKLYYLRMLNPRWISDGPLSNAASPSGTASDQRHQSEGQQYFYTVKCGVEVAPETQNKPALSLTLAPLFPLSITTHLLFSLCVLSFPFTLFLTWSYLLVHDSALNLSLV